jgi:type IV secretion system protein VirB1
VTLRAIARTESAFHQYALSLDHPKRTAREQGLSDGGIFLARQPKDLAEALAWAHWLIDHGRSVSVGLMQVSTQHAADLGVTVDQLFDPCTNVQAGARLLTDKYQEAARSLGEGQAALTRALSEYNSGSISVGLENGYVATVIDREFHPRQLP